MTDGLIAESISHHIRDGDSEKVTLKPFSARFESGSFYAIGGPSGAGKTTLLSILSLALQPSSGSIGWNGRQIDGKSKKEAALWRRSHAGFIFQNSRLLTHMTVSEHIAMAAIIRDNIDAVREGNRLLDHLGLSDKITQFPDQLSGGEKQRLALAQALCAKPSIVFADEPTAALDQHNSNLVAETLKEHARAHGAVVICMTHDQSVCAVANATLMLDKT